MNDNLRKEFGYPISCQKCDVFESKPMGIDRIDPFYKKGTTIKLLIIGQDPTIYNKPERVNTVLMLNEKKDRNGQLRKWLEREIIGVENFMKLELYATNLVKCQFEKSPASSENGALKFLESRFEMCKEFLHNEIKNFKPNIILTLGESAHILFSKEIEVINGILQGKMKFDFTGKFIEAKINDVFFLYSPCPHITTCRFVDYYSNRILKFKKQLDKKLK